MDRFKLFQILPYFFELDAIFFHTTARISPQSDLAFTVRFELQAQESLEPSHPEYKNIGAQIDVTHV